MISRRAVEDDADEFSVRLGFKREMVSFLEDLISDGIIMDPVRYRPLRNRVRWINSL